MLKDSKTIKIMKGSKNRRELTQVKAICFLHIKKQEISIYYDSKEIHAIEFCFWFWCTFWASHWLIKSKINWQRTIKRLPNWAIYRKDCFFLGSVKEVQKEPPEVFYEKAIPQFSQYSQEILQYSQENTCVGVLATLLKRASNAGVFLWILQIF